jgi:hypothetical protein
VLSTSLIAVTSDSLGPRFEGHEVVIAYLRVAAIFAWPVVVFILLWRLRRQIGGFIDRALEIGVGGARVLAQAPRPQTTGAAATPGAAPQIVGRGPGDPVVQEAERLLRENLHLDAAQDTEHQVRTLLGTAAQLSIAWVCERAYSSIFGSQIGALQFLNSQPATRGIVRTNYDVAAANNSELFEHYSFDQWLGFLVNNNLITVQGDEVQITNLGRIFIQYLVQQGLPLWRPN